MRIDALMTAYVADLLFQRPTDSYLYDTNLLTVRQWDETTIHTVDGDAFTGDVLVRSAHAAPFKPTRRDTWFDVVVVSWVPYERGERTDSWLRFYTNCYEAHLILVDHVSAATMIEAGLEHLRHKFVNITGVTPLRFRNATRTGEITTNLTAYDDVGVYTHGGDGERKGLTALNYAIDRASEGGTGLIAPEAALATPERAAVAYVFNDHIGGPLLHHLMHQFNFVVVPIGAAAQLSGYDCRQLHRNLDAVLAIAASAEGNAVNQYAREQCKVLLDEVQQVTSSFDRLPLVQPTSSFNLFDVVFHAVNARGMR